MCTAPGFTAINPPGPTSSFAPRYQMPAVPSSTTPIAQVEWLWRGYPWTNPKARKHSRCGISGTVHESVLLIGITRSILCLSQHWDSMHKRQGGKAKTGSGVCCRHNRPISARLRARVELVFGGRRYSPIAPSSRTPIMRLEPDADFDGLGWIRRAQIRRRRNIGGCTVGDRLPLRRTGGTRICFGRNRRTPRQSQAPSRPCRTGPTYWATRECRGDQARRLCTYSGAISTLIEMRSMLPISMSLRSSA